MHLTKQHEDENALQETNKIKQEVRWGTGGNGGAINAKSYRVQTLKKQDVRTVESRDRVSDELLLMLKKE